MSKLVPNETLKCLMPCFDAAFTHSEEMKEAAILVMGTICDEEGCLG